MLILAAAAAGGGFSWGLLVAALVLGLRHGIDWDHIAAISDITASTGGRLGLRFGTLYAVGHGAVVLVLGLVALEVGRRLPPSVDVVMGRVAGVTLVALAAVVAVSLVRERGRFRMRSRWLLLMVTARDLARRAHRWLGPRGQTLEHSHPHVAVEGFHHGGPVGCRDPGRAGDVGVSPTGDRVRAPVHSHRHAHDGGLDQYTGRVSFGVGMLHGIGAETPTQLVLFVAAANAGGTVAGLGVLVVFLCGLLASNSAITVVGVAGFGRASARPGWHVTMAVLTVVVSLVVGGALLVDKGDALPALFTG
jgi:high-affinity nickel-transport protein